MYLERDDFVIADENGEFAVYPRRGEFASTNQASLPYVRLGNGYGKERMSSVSSMALAIAVHLAIVPVLLGLGYQSTAKREDRFVAVNLTPPPPPASTPDKPQQQKLETRITPPPVPLVLPVSRPVPVAVADPVPLAEPVTLSVPPAPPAPPAQPSTITSDGLGTRMVSGAPPRYPIESRRKKEQGTVELLLTLGIDGAVEAISVVRSSGFARLDEAALSAVRRWRWQPTSRNGALVKVKGVVEIPFVLESA